MTRPEQQASQQPSPQQPTPDALEKFRQAALHEFQQALTQGQPQEVWDRLTNIMREAALQAGVPVPVFTVIHHPDAGDILKDMLLQVADHADYLQGLRHAQARNRTTITQEQARQAAPDIDRAILKAILDLQPVLNPSQLNDITTVEVADRALSRHLPAKQRYALVEESFILGKSSSVDPAGH